MSISLNTFMIAGNLTRDPESRLVGEHLVTSFSVAVNHRFKNKAGETVDEPTYFDCEAWRGTAEFIVKHFKKGKGIYVSGRMKTDAWTDKDGQKRSKLKLVAEDAKFTDSAPEKNDNAPRAAASGSAVPPRGDVNDTGNPPF